MNAKVTAASTTNIAANNKSIQYSRIKKPKKCSLAFTRLWRVTFFYYLAKPIVWPGPGFTEYIHSPALRQWLSIRKIIPKIERKSGFEKTAEYSYCNKDKVLRRFSGL
jgi:hypothetical protein